MDLAQLTTALDIEVQPGQHWAVLGPEAGAFRLKLWPAQIYNCLEPELDGLLLAGALSATSETTTWLEQIIKAISAGTVLVVIDWQADGPLEYGPDLARRFKRGKLCRLLRESGFGLVETLANHSVYYVVQAVKGPPAPLPHAGEFVAVAKRAELPKNAMKKVQVFGHNIIVANTGKEIVAIGQACPHADSPLEQGILRGRHIVCPLHAYTWNVHTGEPVEPADEDTLRLYQVKVDPERDQILVALTPPVPLDSTG